MSEPSTHSLSPPPSAPPSSPSHPSGDSLAQPTTSPPRLDALGALGVSLCVAALLWLWGGVEAKLWRAPWLTSVEALGLSLTLGLGVGVALSATRALAWRLPFAPRASLYALLGAGWGLSLADALNAFTRLEGEHVTLALLTLGASVIGGAGLGTVFALTPHGATQEPLSARHEVRLSLSALTLIGGVGALAADKLLFVGLYPAFHAGLELGAALALTASLSLLRLIRPLSVTSWGAMALKVSVTFSLLLSLTPALTLNAEDDSRVYALEQSGWLSGALTRTRALTDWDNDSYSSWYGGGDCAPYDSNINPGAREVPNNGIDDNCRAGDLTLTTQDFTRAPMPTTPAPQSVVLITIDTTRPDHLSAYGYERNTTPNIKAWAERGVRFDRAYSTSAWTSVAMSSLMRGLYPSHLKWTRVYETSKYRLVRLKETFSLPSSERVRLSFTLPLDDPREPLAATLKARGLYTMAVVDDGYGEFLSPKVGTGEGFERFQLVDKLPRRRRNDEGAIDLALESLKARPEGEPFFLWVHLFGPHDPNHTHRGLKRFGNDLKAKYDHELLFMDQQVGRLLKALDEIEGRERDQGRGLTVALTSDHGELFMGRRRYHGVDLHEQSIRVPMIVVGEGWPSGVVSKAPVSLVDLAPTLLAAADAPAPHPLDGLNLKPLITEGLNPQRLLFAETWYITPTGKIVRDYAAAFDGVWKAIYQRDKQLMTVERQDELKRPAKNWGRKEPQAERVVEGLERYLEASSNDRGATEEQPPAEALRKEEKAPKRAPQPTGKAKRTPKAPSNP